MGLGPVARICERAAQWGLRVLGCGLLKDDVGAAPKLGVLLV